jgi:outer membrane protein assembly factor BamB
MNARIKWCRHALLAVAAYFFSYSPALLAEDWPVGRGNAQSTGVADEILAPPLAVLWKFSAGKDGPFEANAVVADGTVYVGSFDGNLYAIDANTGKKKWAYKTELGFSAAAAVNNGRVFAGDADGVVVCLNADSGEKVWEFTTGGEIDGGLNFYQDKLLVGSQDATLYCLSCETGEKVWEFKIGDQIRALPTVAGNRCFLAGCDGKLHVVDLDTGTAAGTIDIDSPTGCTPAVVDKLVFFGTEGSTFFAIHWADQSVAWKFTSERNLSYRASAAATPQAVVIGGRDKQVLAFEPATGKVQWRYTARHRVDSSPVISGKVVYFGSSDGRVTALNLASGEPVWQYEAGGQFTAAPAIAKGNLFIGNTDGTLYCFGPAKK